MATEKELRLAKNAYDAICEIFDAKNWQYEQAPDALKIRVGVQGDDLPMGFVIKCDADCQLVIIYSQLPFEMSKEKRTEGALATCFINYLLGDGCFDYDISDGCISFRMTASFRESLISPSLLEYMIDMSISTVDYYNDMLFRLSNGETTLEQLITELKKDN